ncbi:MAG TPA: DedA family protein [Streptosporangiaceae bacterium]|nr:DedA family protein [Streptosporangiaceae bacterium]
MESLISHAGYGALVLLGFLEACCIPIPSEITFGFAGVLAYQGHLNVVLVIVIGSLAELCGSYVSYGAGRLGGRTAVERVGRYVLITRADVDRAERFFTGRGEYAVAIGRALPVIRAFTSLVAGFVEVPALQFGVLSLAGTVVYAATITLVGYGFGSAWNSIAHYLSIGGYAIVAIIAGIVAAFIIYRLRELRKEAASGRENAATPANGTPPNGATPPARSASGRPGGHRATGRPRR